MALRDAERAERKALLAMLNSKALEAEIIASVMADGRKALAMLPELSLGDFAYPEYRELLSACFALDQDDVAVNYATVQAALAGERDIGSRLGDLPEGLFLGMLPGALRQLRELRALERAMAAAAKITSLGNGNGMLAQDRISEAQKLAQEIIACTASRSEDVLISLGEVAEREIEMLDRIEAGEKQPETITLGISSLDDVLYIEPGQLVVIGGETASGKSALCGQIAVYQAKQGTPVVFVTSEMHHRQMLVRICSTHSGASVANLTNPRFAAELRAQHLYRDISRFPLYFQRSFPPRIEEAVAAIRTGVAKHGAKLAVIDYAQRLASGDEENQERAIARIAHEAKNLALELGIVVIAAAQVNRQVSQRQGDFRPKLADLRGSGRLEQDADCVLFTYQPSRHGKEGHPEVIVAKQRNGKAGMPIPVSFHPETCTFHSLEGQS